MVGYAGFFLADPTTRIFLAVHPGFFDDWDIMRAELPESDQIEHTIVCGGRNRQESVLNCLKAIRDAIADEGGNPAEAVLAIHDGARPLVSPELINTGFSQLEMGCGLVPAIPCSNSLRELTSPEDGIYNSASVAVERARFVEVQTPQIFNFDELLAANTETADLSAFTDDASIAEAAGIRIKLFPGSPANIKVTHPIDFAIARTLLAEIQK